MYWVRTLPKLEIEGSGWNFDILAGEPYDYSAPFRDILAHAATVFPDEEGEVILPPWEPEEDCLEGTLVVGDREFDIYIEYAHGYMSICSWNKTFVSDLLSHLLPSLTTEKATA